MNLEKLHKQLVGMTLDEARVLVDEDGYYIRVVRRNGANLMGTHDAIMNRINVSVKDVGVPHAKVQVIDEVIRIG